MPVSRIRRRQRGRAGRLCPVVLLASQAPHLHWRLNPPLRVLQVCERFLAVLTGILGKLHIEAVPNKEQAIQQNLSILWTKCRDTDAF